MRVLTVLLLFIISFHDACCQESLEIQIDQNFKLTFPNRLITDSSGGDIIKYSCSTSKVGYQLFTMDDFEVDSKADMHKRLSGLLDVYKEKRLFWSPLERRTDTTIASAPGLYMVVTDTSARSMYKKAQFFFTVQDKRLYALQMLYLSVDTIAEEEVKNFFSNLNFSGKPYFKPGGDATNFEKIIWFIILAVLLGLIMKNIVSKKRSVI